jgi:hypothetical protein
VEQLSDLPAVLEPAVGLGRPVVALVGGARGMDEATQLRLAEVLRDAVVAAVDRHGAAVVDGGTDAGVMRMIGRARAERSATFPLVGVAVEATVRVPGGGPVIDDAADPEPHHTHLVLVPGEKWGDESSWLAAVADVLAAGRPAVTVLVNGGEITYKDAAASLDRGRVLVVLAGTGRTADAIADARAGRPADERAVAIAASPLTRVVAVDDAPALRSTVDDLLS